MRIKAGKSPFSSVGRSRRVLSAGIVEWLWSRFRAMVQARKEAFDRRIDSREG
jgi:hypothetical protein